MNMFVRLYLRKGYNSKQGLTLIEILVAAAILILTAAGSIQLFVVCSRMTALTGNMTLVTGEANNTLEAIRSHLYGLITTDYASGGTPGNTFDLNGLTGKGIIYINASNPDRLKIDVVISWQNEDGRTFGEDVNFNGTLDAGEDTNGDTKITSPLTLSSYIARR